MLKHNVTLENVKKAFKYPRQAVDETLYEVCYRIPATYANTKRTIGTNVFSREWDLLIILDTCRVDALEAVAPEYDFIPDVGSIRSVGGRSPEWIAKTFVEKYEDEIRRTGYLSANVFPERILRNRHHESASISDEQLTYRLLRRIPTVDVDALGHFEYLYRYEPVGEPGPLGHEGGGTPPRYVTDRGIQVGRRDDLDRVILHYLQPHPPYVVNALREGRDELYRYEYDWWGYLGETGDYETIWETYLDELRYVLDDVELLLENVDAETVAISADHGEAFGEYWEYGHKTGSLHPKVRTVPWVETTATDEGTYSPSFDPPSETETDPAIEEQLEALGYRM
ncbi:hypothetical protein [Halosolutus gelatinilyticus]|uniref:hypothetical protein n=1 Tax=Halosolutus gelatinilyticus TaxID=2931975 RepID=UPI001FF18076|nr:hypothetical protein [Halosolutus gelatinilyticus]